MHISYITSTMIVFGHVFTDDEHCTPTKNQSHYIKMYHIDLLVEGELDDDVTRITTDQRVTNLEIPLRILLHLKKRTMM